MEDNKKLKIAVLCPSNIARQRFLPALQKIDDFQFVGVGVCSTKEREYANDLSYDEILKKCKKQEEYAYEIQKKYGGAVYSSYKNVATAEDIDAIYISLPPAMHKIWAVECLKNNKHILMEKPFAINDLDCKSIIENAKKKHLSVHENYMFVFHPQVKMIKEIIKRGELGSIRIIDAKFGFPFRGNDDFRYNKKMGGGALLDCGGYLVKTANIFLDEYDILYANYQKDPRFSVDIFGSATFKNKHGVIMNIAYGMDNKYLCEIRIWGTKGYLETKRFFTSPPDLKPIIYIEYCDGSKKELSAPAVDTFELSLKYFYECIQDNKKAEENYNIILSQSRQISNLMECMGYE